ncbi:PSMD2 [Mytilus coruscus]|uniref:PSMD2 n=1 Tax=Mytilus coruscus TaxID=42192 RepID=A0A6J8AM05_MYTCO|nr:PSMD2 [Mytilus coruscus]
MRPTNMADKKKEEPVAPEKKDEKKDKKGEKEQELSEEDKQLQEELNMLVERLKESDQKLYKPALESLRSQIRASTTSMTSVPKPLKFLRPHYESLKEVYEKIKDDTTKRFCADIVSVLGMTTSDTRESLKYRILGSKEEIGSWGHEYVRHIAGQVAQEWQDLEEKNTEMRDKLLTMTKEIVPYHMDHNAEAEACDLLMEIEKLDILKNYVDENAYPRVCLYLTSCVPYVPDPENITLMKTAVDLYRKFNQFPQAIRFAMQLNDMKMVEEIFISCKDILVQKQLAYMLGRQQIFLELPDDIEEFDELTEIMSNAHLNNNFLALARELDIMEPKVPEDIYKSHLEQSRSSLPSTTVDSARQNLASSFVNGFVNAAFGQDKLLMEDGNTWLYKNKEHGMLSATASLGLILLWDVDGGLTQIDKYLYSSEDFIKAGALLACGIVNSGVRNECDPAVALLSDYVMHNTAIMRIGAIVGLGLAYAGSNREDVLAIILPVLGDTKCTMEVIGMAALSCGMIAVGSCNADVTSTILQTMMERSEADLKDTHSRYLALGLALAYLGKQEAVDATLMALEVIAEPLKSMAMLLVEVCAYAGNGMTIRRSLVDKMLEKARSKLSFGGNAVNPSVQEAGKKLTCTAKLSELACRTSMTNNRKSELIMVQMVVRLKVQDEGAPGSTDPIKWNNFLHKLTAKLKINCSEETEVDSVRTSYLPSRLNPNNSDKATHLKLPLEGTTIEVFKNVEKEAMSASYIDVADSEDDRVEACSALVACFKSMADMTSL